jgi:hypothetical protein
MWIKIQDPSDLPDVDYENYLELEGQYYRISTSSGSEKLQKIYMKCFRKFIFLYITATGRPVAYMDILFSKVKVLAIDGARFDRDGQTIYGIRIIKDKKFEELLHTDKKEAAKIMGNLFYFYNQQQSTLKTGESRPSLRITILRSRGSELASTQRCFRSSATLTTRNLQSRSTIPKRFLMRSIVIGFYTR